jgi:hypothetical protein
MIANLEAVEKLKRFGYRIVTKPVRLKYGLPESEDHLYLYRLRHGLIDLFTVSITSAANYTGCREAVVVRGNEREKP